MKNGLGVLEALRWTMADRETHEKIATADRLIEGIYYALNWNGSHAMPVMRYFFAENNDGSFDTDLCAIQIVEPDTHFLDISVAGDSVAALVSDILTVLNNKVVMPFLSI